MSESAVVIPEDRLFVSPKEVAAVTRSDPRTVRRAAERGEIPSTRLGTKILIPASWLREKAGLGGGNAATA
jgi:excisionase family DNA binding protein